MRDGSDFRNQMCATGVASVMWPMRSRRTLRLDHLDAALLAHDAAVLHALVLAAVALVVLDRTEDLGAEEPVAFRLEGPVVDRLRLLHLAERPLADLVGRRDRDPQRVERERILGLLEQAVEIAQGAPPDSLALRALTSSGRFAAPSLVFDELDVEAERLELLDEHVEALRQARLEHVLALHDRLVDARAALHVVGLHGQELLQRERGAVGLERPHLHLAEPLAAELRLAAERLLGDEAVGPDAARVDLVVGEVVQLQHVEHADGDLVVERLAGATVEQHGLTA